jgi:beta-galactosidase
MDSPSTAVGRERLSLDRGWRFHLGDIPFPLLRGHGDSYTNAKAGKTWGAAAAEHDDTAWRELDLPHDWAVEGPFDPAENLSQGYRPRGIAWYRRHFQLPPFDRGRHLELQFDGIATHCTVWVNGTIAHRNWCGYTSFAIDITPFAKFGEELNTVAVRVDASVMEGWWYEGAGIYRHTWLVKRDRTHLVTDGIFATPVRGAGGGWTLPVEATVANSGATAETVGIETTLFDPAGQRVAHGRTAIRIEPLAEAVANLSLAVAAPRLWSVDDPALYAVRTGVTRDGHEVDAVTTPCGFRTLRFDANEGFFLNDRPLKLKGVCNHQDHAGVGVALPDALWEFRVRQLKEMGVNAYRCAHNPPSAEFLQFCDRLGVLVMDENRHFNPTPEYLRQLEWLIRRDRNHPSVFLWSVFNEEPMQGTETGYEMVRRMVALVKRLDPTRPVTAAMNGGLFNPVNVAKAVDVVGFNYQIEFYDRFHAANPTLPLTSSEDTSAFMTRGEFATDKARNVLASDDTECAPWGATHRDGWRAIAERPYLAGSFVWTGFDYRGEPTPLNWPTAGSFFGCMDLCGFPKTAFFIHQAHWIEHRPVLQIAPHWNWPGREGQPIRVLVCTNADSVALSLNGESLGEKTTDKYDLVTWDVPYAAGRLEAVAAKNGREVARAFVETVGPAVALRLVPDRTELAGDGADAQPVTVQAVDAHGRPVPTANLPVEFELAGPGTIIGLGNGDPNCHEPEKGNRRSLFNGLAQVIVQSTPGSSGKLVLRAKASGLTSAEIAIDVNAVPAPPRVPPCQSFLSLQIWRMSPVTLVKPDPNLEVADSDMNTWVTVMPGELKSFAGGNWSIFRIRFRPFVAVQNQGGRLVFKSITGQAEVWLDRNLLGRKESFAAAPLVVAIPSGVGERTLSVLIESHPSIPAGLGDAIVVQTLPPTNHLIWSS